MRLTLPRRTIPGLMIEVFLVGLALAFFVDLRARARRKAALPAAQAAYQTARAAREAAEWTAMRMSNGKIGSADPAIKDLRRTVEHARAEERARRAEYDRLRPTRTWLSR